MKPIARYENRYLIRQDGVILNLANNSSLQPSVNPNGYLKVGLANGDGTSNQFMLHILVAKHFLPNPYDHPQVNHKDGKKLNCASTNLEWVSAQENNEHALRTGLRPGYMSADDKEILLRLVLQGRQINDLALETTRRPETLHKMLRTTAERLGIKDQWDTQMKENRKRVAIRNIASFNDRNSFGS